MDLPGGSIKFLEKVEDSLKREFEEEIGLKINKFKLKKIVTNYVVWDLDETHKEEVAALKDSLNANTQALTELRDLINFLGKKDQ